MTTKKLIKKNVFLYRTLSALFVSGVVLSAVSCANDDIEANADSGDKVPLSEIIKIAKKHKDVFVYGKYQINILQGRI